MNIGQKLLLGLGLFTIFFTVAGLMTYREIKLITDRLGYLEVADDVAITMLEVRRYEKNILLYKDASSLPNLIKNLNALKNSVQRVGPEIARELGEADYEQMLDTIDHYDQWVQNVVSNHNQQARLVDEVVSAGRLLESSLGGTAAHDRLLVLRRYEKNLMLYKDKASYDSFSRGYAALGLSGRQDVKGYGELVDRLYSLYEKEDGYVAKMRGYAREVQSFTVNLSRAERSKINASLMYFSKVLALSLVGMLVLGIVINFKLSTSISRPIKELERITKKVAWGDFSEVIDVSGNDEVASLGRSFNHMAARLKETLQSLEDIIKMLEDKQAQLVEAEKLASVGLLVAGVAHEINNPLTSVMTFTNLMLEKLPEDDPNRERLKMMASEANRARTIVRQLLSFARETPASPVHISINEPVREIVDSLAAQGRFADIELVVDLSEGMPEVNADPAQIGQVVLNLVQNAINAITPPGRITIATRAAGGWAELVVSDTGCGIPEENIRRIFEPFFTTSRSTSQGTGLGLAVSYGIIKKHRGDIEVSSEPGRGSTFTVRLPLNG